MTALLNSETSLDDTLDEVIVTTEPSEAYLGAVMHQSVAFWATVNTHHIRGEDFADPRHRVVYRLAHGLARQGIAPDPAAILAHAQRSGEVTGAHRIAALSKLLIDLFTRCPLPGSVGYYAIAVLDAAVRRRITEAGQRLMQAADECALREAVEMVRSESVAVAALVERRRRAIEGDPHE